MSLQRILTAVLYILVLIISVAGLVIIFGADTIGEKDSGLKILDPDMQKGTGLVLMLSYVLLTILLIAALILSPVIGISQNPKSLKSAGIGLGALVVVFIIGYAMAGNEVTAVYQKMGITTPGQSKMVGAVLNSVYILFIVGIGAYLYSSVNSLLKQF